MLAYIFGAILLIIWAIIPMIWGIMKWWWISTSILLIIWAVVIVWTALKPSNCCVGS
jgi:hypothetical protein